MPIGGDDWLALPPNLPWSPRSPSATRITTCGNFSPNLCPINGTFCKSWQMI